MNGMELSRAFYFQYRSEVLSPLSAEMRERVAVGLVGEGSECFGFDDAVSRDHDWGAGFCIWLTDPDAGAWGKLLEDRYVALPDRFMGYPVKSSRSEQKRVGVFSIQAFYKRFLCLPSVPDSNEFWLALPEENLAVATNGEVFCDPLGEFSTIRQTLLRFYPDDVRRKKLAARCFEMGQAGQYNLPRLLRRGDTAMARLAFCRFSNAAISAMHLINRRYTPFYKWGLRSLQALPIRGTYAEELLRSGLMCANASLLPDITEQVCLLVAGLIREEGIADCAASFLCDFAPHIQASIKDEAIRHLPLQMG